MPWPSVAALGLASASLLLAFTAIVWGGLQGGFRYYDPLLMSFYRYGFFVSSAGLLLGLIGVFFLSSARWQAPVAAFGMLFFWLACAATE